MDDKKRKPDDDVDPEVAAAKRYHPNQVFADSERASKMYAAKAGFPAKPQPGGGVASSMLDHHKRNHPEEEANGLGNTLTVPTPKTQNGAALQCAMCKLYPWQVLWAKYKDGQPDEDQCKPCQKVREAL